MQNFLLRIGSGFLYAAVLIVALFLGKLYYLGLICTLSFFLLVEFCRLKFSTPKGLYFIFPGLVFFHHYFNFDLLIASIAVISNTYLAVRLIRRKSYHFKKNIFYTLAVFYGLFSLYTFFSLSAIGNDFDSSLILGFLLLIWSTDSFAYAVGKMIGKHFLSKTVSPKKTVEGAIGGIVLTICLSSFFPHFFPYYSATQWIIIGTFTSVLAIIGDLIQSKFKRTAQVKDSGNILPGHGGLYDRMDSLIFTSPYIYCIIYCLNYVS